MLLAYDRNPRLTLRELTTLHGDVAPFQIGPQPALLLNHPDLVREVLVTRHRAFSKGIALQRAKRLLGEGLLTSEGELHRRQRRLVQPAFHRERILGYGRVMVEHAERTRTRWERLAPGPIDVAPEMTRLTLGVVGRTLFDADVEDDSADIGRALTDALRAFASPARPFPALVERLPLPRSVRFRRARRRLDSVVARLVAERRAAGLDHGDLLSMLLLARDAEGDGGGMSDTQVRDEALTLLLAGHETTANALTWTWWLLGEHPDVERALHAELDAVLGRKTLEPEDAERLPYTRAVIAESMRLWPPAWVIGRRALEDLDLGGVRAARGTLVLVSPWLVQRDPRWWPEAERFDPARWLDAAAQAARPRFAYFPFGGGPRGCVGESFAWMEAVLLLASLASRWRLRLVPGHPVEPQALLTLRPRHGMRMTLERRDAAA